VKRTDTLQRRLRFAEPAPVVRRLGLTDADYVLFGAIERHGPLPTHYLYEFTKHLRRNYSHLQNRLTEFYNGDEGGAYLTRPSQQFAGFQARYQHLVYDLSRRGRRVAGADRARRRDPFLHQLMTACVGASLELCAGRRGTSYVSRAEILRGACAAAWRSKNVAALPLPDRHCIVPDDLCGLRLSDGRTRYCAIEIDRNTESLESRRIESNTIAKKIAAYSAALDARSYQAWWNIPNMGVLIATTNQTHARNILDCVNRHAGAWKDRFAVQVVAEFGPNWRVPRSVLTDLIDSPWHTVAGTKDLASG
jgi:hypothetical protein